MFYFHLNSSTDTLTCTALNLLCTFTFFFSKIQISLLTLFDVFQKTQYLYLFTLKVNIMYKVVNKMIKEKTLAFLRSGKKHQNNVNPSEIQYFIFSLLLVT